MDMSFPYAELLCMRSALESQISTLRVLISEGDLSPDERNQLLSTLQLSRSAYKRLGRYLGATSQAES